MGNGKPAQKSMRKSIVSGKSRLSFTTVRNPIPFFHPHHRRCRTTYYICRTTNRMNYLRYQNGTGIVVLQRGVHVASVICRRSIRHATACCPILLSIHFCTCTEVVQFCTAKRTPVVDSPPVQSFCLGPLFGSKAEIAEAL